MNLPSQHLQVNRRSVSDIATPQDVDRVAQQRQVTDPDHLLLDQYAQGDVSALEQLLCRHKKMIHDLAYRILQNEADAADVTQHVLLKASTYVDKFRGDSTFKTWLFSIGLNLSRNAIRDRQRWQHEDLEGLQLPDSEDPFKTAATRETQERLKTAIGTLPPRQFKAVMLRVYQEQPFAEVAATMGCTVGTAKANYYHAVKALRRLLVDHSHTNEEKEGVSLLMLRQRRGKRQITRIRGARNRALRAA